MKRYYSHGKLLLTGEYVVLDGAISLAIPTKFGQDLLVKPIEDSKLLWKSFDENNVVWFEATFLIKNNEILKPVQDNDSISNRLLQILNAAKQLNPEFLHGNQGFDISTQLEFPKNWGLGTSSTLVHNISKWAKINPYTLLDLTFGGSGYDIACAEAKGPITYKKILNQVQDDNKQDNKKREIKIVSFNPSFKSHLYFVHLNQKQNSREGISQYRANTSDLRNDIEQINRITHNMIGCDSLEHFQELIDGHEQIISKIIKQKPIKEQLFKDFNGSIKSLGAWGGDFVLAASDYNPKQYFKDKGFLTVIAYDDMILN